MNVILENKNGRRMLMTPDGRGKVYKGNQAMNTMTARRVSRKPSTPIHFDSFGAPLRRVGFTEADRTEAVTILNENSNDFDVVSPAPVKPAIVKTARKPIFEYRRITDEIFSPIENPLGYRNELAYIGWDESLTVD